MGASHHLLELQELLSGRVAVGTKGVPPGVFGAELHTIARQRINLLAGDVPLPACALLDDAVTHNRAVMREFITRNGLQLAPHGKTTMAPQLFADQLADGAWALTAATPAHVYAYRSVRVPRILYANQLVDPLTIQFVAQQLREDPAFEFICLVDSRASVEILLDGLRHCDLQRPVDVLVEFGISGHRAGARTVAGGLDAAREVLKAASRLRLRGVEAFEGVVPGGSDGMAKVAALVQNVTDAVSVLHAEGAFHGLRPVISIGGSAYFGLVAEGLRAVPFPADLVLRSGCYIVNDHGMYAHLQREQTALGHLPLSAPFRPALEVWGHVQSRPEPELAIVGVGKRDISSDIELPIAVKWAPRGRPLALPLTPALPTRGLNDQHAMVQVPADHPLAVGDRVAFGCSHPCTTMDKWRVLLKVDNQYNVLDAIATLF